MSSLTVQNIQGSASSSNTINVASGHILNAPGHVIQTVQAVKTDTTASSSQSFVDISGLSVSITPASAASKFLITCNFCFSGALYPNDQNQFQVSTKDFRKRPRVQTT